jgi:hypothetical protein
MITDSSSHRECFSSSSASALPIFLTKSRQVYMSCHILRSRYRVGSEDTRCLVSRIPSRSSCALTRGVRACWTSVFFVGGFPNSKTCRSSFFSEFPWNRSDDYEWIFWACFSWSLITSAPFFVKPKRSTSTTNIALRKNITFAPMRTKSIHGLNHRGWYEYRKLCWKWYGAEIFYLHKKRSWFC